MTSTQDSTQVSRHDGGQASEEVTKEGAKQVSMKVVDCDVHQQIGDRAEFNKYLPRQWHRTGTPGGMPWPGAIGHSTLRHDARPPSGGPAGSDPAYMIEHHFEDMGIEYAILTGGGVLGANVHSNSHYALAFAKAYNDWMIDKWLSFDPRFKGSMMIAPQDIAGSIKEIERIGKREDIVQIVMASASPLLYGKPYFWPLYEVAQEYNLPVAIHPGTEGKGVTTPTGSGYPSYYIEWHTMLATGYINHLISLICEGVFAKFPRLKFVMIEGGVSWVPPIMWRLDKNWKALRSEVPWLDRLPSEYMKSNVRFTTQPIEEPEDESLLVRLFEEMDAASTVMFSSDYPHWDFDSVKSIFRRFPESLKRRILSENAKELYGLP